MKTLRSVSSALLVGSVAWFAPGCSTVSLDKEGEMQATYVAGEFRMLVNADAPRTAAATSAAFKQLGLFEVKKDLKTFEAQLAARTPKDEKVRVSIKEINSKQTELGIRVDVAGDRSLSRRIYDRIEQNLGGASARGVAPAAGAGTGSGSSTGGW